MKTKNYKSIRDDFSFKTYRFMGFDYVFHILFFCLQNKIFFFIRN